MNKQTVAILMLLVSSVWLNNLQAEALWKNWSLSKPIYAGIGYSKNDIALITGTEFLDDINTKITADESDSGFHLLAGMNFTDWLDLEVRFLDLGAYSFNTQIVDSPGHRRDSR